MDVPTFVRIAFWQSVAFGVNYMLQNLAILQIPFAGLVLPIFAAFLNAVAAYVRDHYLPVKVGDQPSLFARVF